MTNPLKARTSIKCPAVPKLYKKKWDTRSELSQPWSLSLGHRGDERGTIDLKVLKYAALQTSNERDNRWDTTGTPENLNIVSRHFVGMGLGHPERRDK
jgi:hypothetical protein